MTTRAIWWIRRDLRLADNAALTAACTAADEVIPLFVVDPALTQSASIGDRRLAFLWAGLRQLDDDLRQRGARLIVRQGAPAAVLAQLLAETGAARIDTAEAFSPYGRARDAEAAASLPLHRHPGILLHHPDTIETRSGSPYTVFTPYSKTWRERPFPARADLLPPPERLATPPDLHSLPLPDSPALPAAVPFAPGEAAAQRRLAAFAAARIADYAADRDRMDLDGTSGLSPYLRFGMLSARQAVVAALEARAGAETDAARRGGAAQRGADTWLNELIWREFYVSILYHFPRVLRGSFRPEYNAIAWSNDAAAFDAWRNGRTGYPVVDAAMRQLSATGWMHNRARMIVASFLVKDLLINWQWGERWFMQQLIDGDPAANNGGWQWSAGTGTDAAPYFRIFNPVSQGQKFDPHGRYIRRWVPELANVAPEYLHEPWRMPPLEQRRSGCLIGETYPKPIVNHQQARQRTLNAYKLAREGAVSTPKPVA